MKNLAIAQRAINLATSRFALRPGSLRVDADLYAALDLDSIQALDLLSLLEVEFGVDLPDYEMAAVRSFGDLAERIADRL